MDEPLEPVSPPRRVLRATRRGLDAQQRVALVALLLLVAVLLLDGVRVYGDAAGDPAADALAPRMLPVLQGAPASAASAPRVRQAQA